MDSHDHSVALVVGRLRAAGCVFAEDETALLLASTDSSDELERRIEERVSGVPLEHVLGWAEFCGVRIEVDRGVFVPRPRTEYLVARALRMLDSGDLVIDLCCGTGAIGAALLRGFPSLDVVASDVDPRAVDNARRTLPGARVVLGDLYESIPADARGRASLITIVAPYVPTGELDFLPREARDFEPVRALDGGIDGLDILARAITEAPGWLAPGGSLLTEVSEGQAETVANLLGRAGLAAFIEYDEDAGATLVVGTRT